MRRSDIFLLVLAVLAAGCAAIPGHAFEVRSAPAGTVTTWTQMRAPADPAAMQVPTDTATSQLPTGRDSVEVQRGGILQEAVINTVSPQSRMREMQIGVQKVDVTEMVKTPVLFGERDILKAIQLLPGINAEGDGTSGFQVRGGTSS